MTKVAGPYLIGQRADSGAREVLSPPDLRYSFMELMQQAGGEFRRHGMQRIVFYTKDGAPLFTLLPGEQWAPVDVAPVSPVDRTSIILECAAVAGQEPGHVSQLETFSRGYRAGRSDAGRDVLKLAEQAA